MWVAYSVEENPFAKYSLEQIDALLGLQMDAGNTTIPNFDMEAVSVPASFDGRVTYSSCQKAVRNQESCGSCWAFAAAETLTTNICVLSQASVPVLSPQDLVSCDTTNHACNGGNLNYVWSYILGNGVRSDACVPYTSGGGEDAPCTATCPGGGSNTHYKCPSSAYHYNSDSAIQQAVYTVGAAETGFSVYSDFMSYKSGIYKHQSGDYRGGHAVKIVGWGQQSSTFYWIVQNSWGPDWGEQGFFRIANYEEDDASNFARGGAFGCGSSKKVIV